MGGGRSRTSTSRPIVGALEMLMKGCTACYDLTAEFPLPDGRGSRRLRPSLSRRGHAGGCGARWSRSTHSTRRYPACWKCSRPACRPMWTLPAGSGDASLANMRRWLHHFPNGGLVVPAVAPTIPHHCSDAFMCGCADLSREFGVGLHSHVQESKVQVIAGLKRYAKTQTAHLEDLGLLGPDFTVAHGVWLDGDDMTRLADHGCSVSHNPGSNMRLGNGLADMRGMLSRGVNVGIGTDGANCSDNLNMYENMRLASMISKVQSPDTENWMTTEQVFEAATIGSAKALGFERTPRPHRARLCGRHRLSRSRPHQLDAAERPTNQVVHTEDGTGVHSVMVAGRMVVEDGKVSGST